MIKYYLTENKLTERDGDYMAHVESKGTATIDDVIDRMLDKGSLVTKTDIMAVLNNFEEAVVKLLSEGNTVNMSLFNAGFSISGVFESSLDTFDAERHKFNINVAAGTLLRNAQKNVKLTKIEHTAEQGKIKEIKDSASQTTNATLTPNGILEIYGVHIKVAGDNPECGVYFVNTNGNETKATVIAQNTPSIVIVQIPALEAGSYNIKIVTQHTGSYLLKQPKTVISNKELTV